MRTKRECWTSHSGETQAIVLVAELVAIFKDAAGFDLGQGEDLGLVLQGFGLDDQLLVGLAGEGDDGAIAVDGAALDVGDPEVAAGAGELHVAVLLALVAEDLEAHVDGLHVVLVVGEIFAVEVDGVSVGSRGLGGHLQLFGRGLLPIGGEGGRGKSREKEKRDVQGPEWHRDLEQWTNQGQ